MSSFGETLRTAREAKGLTCSQVAAQTHMLVQIVEEMEREDFHRIPAPIYGRGFVRLFADCVGLDPVPLVREFMDIYEGRRAPTVSIREVPTASIPPPVSPTWQTAITPQPVSVEPAPEPAPNPVTPPKPEPVPVKQPDPEPITPPEPEPVVEPKPEPIAQPELVAPPEPEPVPVVQPEPDPEPNPEPIQEPPQVVRGLELFEQAPSRSFSEDDPLFGPATTPVQPPSERREPPPIDPNASPYLMPSGYGDEDSSAAIRFREGLSAVSSSIVKKVRGIPRRVWRMTALLLCAILAIAFIVWSIGKLYKATSKPDETPTAEVAPTPTEPKGTEASAQVPTSEKTTKKSTAPAKPAKLISTGQVIPNLISD